VVTETGRDNQRRGSRSLVEHHPVAPNQGYTLSAGVNPYVATLAQGHPPTPATVSASINPHPWWPLHPVAAQASHCKTQQLATAPALSHPYHSNYCSGPSSRPRYRQSWPHTSPRPNRHRSGPSRGPRRTPAGSTSSASAVEAGACGRELRHGKTMQPALLLLLQPARTSPGQLPGK
ncbi:unnamed protein product, partial [Ixodes persulcatus]